MNFLRNFMAGRYGPDNLNTALIITGLLLSLLSRVPYLNLLVYVSYLFLILAVLRMLGLVDSRSSPLADAVEKGVAGQRRTNHGVARHAAKLPSGHERGKRVVGGVVSGLPV